MKKQSNQRSTNFVPYVSPEKSLPELTLLACALGILLAIVFGAANAYLGLKIGMTVSASIPAAVISMGILRGLFRGRQEHPPGGRRLSGGRTGESPGRRVQAF